MDRGIFSSWNKYGIQRIILFTDDSLIEESPIFSILKKPNKFSKKLDASIGNYSKVEISPGLFVKRPSSKTKMQPPQAPPPVAKPELPPEQA